jgi:acetoin utilization protein AcuB
MLVKERMTQNPVTVSPNTSVSEALNLMRKNDVRRMPVLDKKNRLVGIVAEKDLLYASPSPATSLNVYEIGYLLSKLKIREIMSENVITVTEDAPLEEAARIMADNGISGLPVMRDRDLVGIITETDIFKAMLEMMGARDEGLRITILVHDEPGALSRIAGAITNIGGDIVALGTFYSDEQSHHGTLVVKVRGVNEDALVTAMNEIDAKVLDLRVP